MTINPIKVRICDDWLSYNLPNATDAHIAANSLKRNTIWTEVVPGVSSIAVQFDPASLKPSDAARIFSNMLLEANSAALEQVDSIEIPVCYDACFAPDGAKIAEAQGFSYDELINWYSNLEFSVTILGFMPGFAYLRCGQKVAEIGRLDHPRQNVPAGSIGFIGSQSCIYSFDSPGGWPIIGRTPVTLFDSKAERPALLTAGQSVSFQPIDKAMFEKIASGEQSWR